MTPKEKAKEIVYKFYDEIKYMERAKQCAMIAVDEVLNVLPQQEYLEDRGEYSENRERIYWKEVKREIENL